MEFAINKQREYKENYNDIKEELMKIKQIMIGENKIIQNEKVKFIFEIMDTFNELRNRAKQITKYQ